MSIEPDTAAVRELIDRAVITEVLHSYARLVDERDFAAVAELFTDDCLAEYGVEEADILHSASDLAEWLTNRVGVSETSHHISNVQIRLRGTDQAEATSYVYAWHRIPGLPVEPVVMARYVDVLARGTDGWRIAHRSMHAHGLVDFPDGVIRPLTRRPGLAPDLSS
jgi:3-phenylpropionate/cinnamic acid dioxygenase small subunit